MRISDWSSDVCSSDLKIAEETELSARAAEVAEKLAHEIDETRRKVDENLAASKAAAAAARVAAAERARAEARLAEMAREHARRDNNSRETSESRAHAKREAIALVQTRDDAETLALASSSEERRAGKEGVR